MREMMEDWVVTEEEGMKLVLWYELDPEIMPPNSGTVFAGCVTEKGLALSCGRAAEEPMADEPAEVGEATLCEADELGVA